MTADRLSASVIVTTRNRANDLRRLLPSLCQLTHERLEAIVVVGPSDDDTWEVVGRYRDRMKIVECPVANMCHSRNLGLNQAAGDVVIFIDDDGMPATRSWVEALLEPFARDERVGAAGGPVYLRDTETYQFRNGAVSEYGEHRFTAAAEDDQPLPPGWYRRSMGTNAAFRREALLSIGGFDEAIVYYGDECDVCVRLAQHGYRYAYVESAPVRHYPAHSPHRHIVDRTRTVTHDDTYFCLKNARASLVPRVLATLRRAPRKHYVQEVVQAWRSGTLSGREYGRFWWLWGRGLAAACRDALLRPRKATPRSSTAPVLLPLPRRLPDRRLTVVLTARQLAPDGPCEGPARYTYDLAEGLHALGHDVHVIGESPVPRRHLWLGLTVHGIAPAEIVDHLLPKHGILNANVAYALAVARRLRELERGGLRPDVVHTTNWNFEALGPLLARRIPVVMMLVTSLSEVIEYEHWVRNDDLVAGEWLDRAQMRAAAALTAPTHGLIRKYLESGLLDAELVSRAAVTALGIKTRDVPEVGPVGHRLLFVGTHVRRKGLDDLLAVLPALLVSHLDWSCDIVGDDTRVVEQGQTLKGQFLAQHAGEPWLGRVRFRGRVPDEALWRYYAAASVYVVPSRFESFGLTYLEAMQFGVPVVATTAGGIPEVVRDGETGILVPAGDRTALSEAIERLISDDRLRARMGQAAREDVATRWTHVHMAERLLAVYRAAIEAGVPANADGPAAPGEAILAAIRDAGAPDDLLERLQKSLAFEGDCAERQLLIDAACGRLPSALYLPAVESCLGRGEAERAIRLLDDACHHASHLGASDQRELAALRFVAERLAPGASGPQKEVLDVEEGRGDLEEALALLREGRLPLAMARLWPLALSPTRTAVQRLTAAYHLGSALKRCGYAVEAEGWLRGVLDDREAALLPREIRAAAWFHAGELALGAGNTADAATRFARCLQLNPLHGRAAALLAEISGGAAAAG